MRLVTFQGGGSQTRSGAMVTRDGEEQLVDLAAASGGTLPASLLALLEAGPDALARARDLLGRTKAFVPLETVTLLAPLSRPPKLLAAAANYQAHILESSLPPVDKSRILPKLFIKPSSSVQAPGAPLVLPSVSQTVDWELELAVVIGRRASGVPVESALDVVAGYTIINDVSARSMDWGLADREPNDWNGFFDWLNGKWLDGFAPLGPWLVTADEIPDPQALAMELRVNGEVKQSASTAEMLFGVAELISFASRFMTLEAGDVIATGTPSGVGATTETYLAAGDLMEGTIAGLGVLRTPVVAAQPA